MAGGLGYLFQGLTQGLQQGREFKRQKEEDAIRQDYMNTQKKILKIQSDLAEKEENWWNTQSPEVQKIRFLPKEYQSIAMMMAGMKGLPDITGGKTQPVDLTGAMSTEQGPVIPSQGGLMPQGQVDETGMPIMPEQGGTGLPDMMAGITMEDLKSGIFKKTLGIDPFETSLRSIKGPKGGPVTQPVRVRTGEPVGKATEEPIKWQLEETYDPEKNQYHKIWMNPYTGEEMENEGITPEGKKVTIKGILSKPGDIDTVTYLEDGVTKDQDFMKGQRGEDAKIGQPRVKQGKPQQTAIYEANIKRVGIPAVDGLIKNLFVKKNGKVELTLNARIQGTFPDISQKLGGQIANDAMKLAFSLLRPESGALINQQELGIKISQQLPKAFTSSEYAVENLLQIGDVIDSYLQGIDPDYQPQARKILQQRLDKFTGKKPSLKLGKEQGKDASTMTDEELLKELNK